jgi:hypothetical protein
MARRFYPRAARLSQPGSHLQTLLLAQTLQLR